MRKSELFLSIACAGFAVAGALLFRQWNTEQESAAAETARRMDAETKLSELQKRYDSLQADYETLVVDRRSSAANAATPNAEPRSADSQFSNRPGQNYSTAIGSETRERTTRPESRYPGFTGPGRNDAMAIARTLKLSPSDAGKFVAVLSEDQEKFRQALQSNDGNPLAADVVESMRDTTAQSLRELLGDQKYQEYEDYRRYRTEYEQVNRLNTRLANTNQSALTPVQQTQFFEALKEERNRTPQPAVSQFTTQKEYQNAVAAWREAYIKRSQTRAAEILTPEQLNVYQDIRGPGGFRGPPPQSPQ